MATFYAPDIATSSFLPEGESLHCSKVLRLRAGDEVTIIDGAGGRYTARVVAPHPKYTEVEIVAREQFSSRDFGVHVAIAPTKNIDRLEWFLEKATEIGIDEITPLLSEHSERKQVNLERMLKILISATKQSKNVFVPRLNPLCAFSDFVRAEQSESRYIAHCYKNEKRPLFLEPMKGRRVTVLIGPEGDFSEQEVGLALQNGFVPVSLGESRLRTETAGVVACHIVNLAQML